MKQVNRVIKKAVKTASRAVNKRYFKKKSGYTPKIGRIIKDVSILKSMLNAEKKTYTQQNNLQLVAQVNGNSSGHFILDITPTPSQGTTNSTRNGSSIRLSASYLQFLISTQSGLSKNIRLKFEIVKYDGKPISTSQAIADYLDPNPFISDQTIYDTNCSRNIDTFKQFRVLRRKIVSFKPSFSGQILISNLDMPLKYKSHHIKFDNNLDTVVDGQLFLIVRADTGNSNTSTANTSTSSGVMTKGTLTGCFFSYNFIHYFYDN